MQRTTRLAIVLAALAGAATPAHGTPAFDVATFPVPPVYAPDPALVPPAPKVTPSPRKGGPTGRAANDWTPNEDDAARLRAPDGGPPPSPPTVPGTSAAPGAGAPNLPPPHL